MTAKCLWFRIDILDTRGAPTLTPADIDWLFEAVDDDVLMSVESGYSIFLEATGTTDWHAQRLFDVYLSIAGRLRKIFTNYRVEGSACIKMWMNTISSDDLERLKRGPLEAASVVQLVDYIDALTEMFDGSMTLDDVSNALYECLSDVVMCPACSGLGRHNKTTYCTKCAGTGYIYVSE